MATDESSPAEIAPGRAAMPRWLRLAGAVFPIPVLRASPVPATAALVFLAALALFLIAIDQPQRLYFDEVHYVTAARQLLQGAPNSNWEHPPLGKEMIAAGMALFGDDPFGWRFMGALFGALAAAGVYLWARALFGEEGPARWAVAAALVNQVLYVQSRIAMLDIFATAFILWALAAFAATWSAGTKNQPRLLYAAGACLGFAAASKWIGVVAWMLIVAIVAVINVLQRWKTRFADPAPSDWYRPDLWDGIAARDWLLALFAVPVALYAITFAPLGRDALMPVNLLDAQLAMWGANAAMTGTHPYVSSWLSWPAIGRPVWYMFEARGWNTAAAQAHGIVFLGNPVIFWGGLFAIFVCLRDWIVHRRADAFLIAAAYFALYLVWAVVPRKYDFAFYYFPSAMTLCVALAYLFYRTALVRSPWTRTAFLAAAALAFLYFLPVSNGAIGFSQHSFNRLMWLASWR